MGNPHARWSQLLPSGFVVILPFIATSQQGFFYLHRRRERQTTTVIQPAKRCFDIWVMYWSGDVSGDSTSNNNNNNNNSSSSDSTTRKWRNSAYQQISVYRKKDREKGDWTHQSNGEFSLPIVASWSSRCRADAAEFSCAQLVGVEWLASPPAAAGSLKKKNSEPS